MSTNNSLNVRISLELHKIIEETMKLLNPIQQKLTGNNISYVGASKMIALKLKKYTIPFTNEVYKELNDLSKESGKSK